MNAEFNWWLLIVGLVAGAGLVWLVIADWSRRDEDLSEDERQAESAWIAQVLSEQGERLDPGEAEHVLALHRAYLRQTGALEADEPFELPVDEPPAIETPLPVPGVEPVQAAEAPEPEPRSSVRAGPMSPRGNPVRVESEPPRPT